MANEVGVIGQTYENRKSHKIGVVESRDEKCKTLMMRDPDGNSFVTTYSTFKSNWRKSGEEVVATSTQVEEKKKQVKDAEKKVEKKPRAPKMDIKEKIEILEAEKQIIQPILDKSKVNLTLTTNSRGALKIRLKGRTLIEIWIRFNENKLSYYLPDDVFQNLKFVKEEDVVVEEHDYKLKWRVVAPTSKSASHVKEVVSVISQIMEEKKKEGEE